MVCFVVSFGALIDVEFCLCWVDHRVELKWLDSRVELSIR